jgi:hypothetical protein
MLPVMNTVVLTEAELSKVIVQSEEEEEGYYEESAAAHTPTDTAPVLLTEAMIDTYNNASFTLYTQSYTAAI